MASKHTERIRIWGIVQGVGFRPFVAKLAGRFGMHGTVLNIGGLVDITVTDTEERIGEFLRALESEKPDPSEIVHMDRKRIPTVDFTDFRILKSAEGDDEAAMIPPDMAICPECLRELYDNDDPRHEHPFISCMLCGPRYTIIDRIPYDRDNTSMVDFPMCDLCRGQYEDIGDRRHHAQTISCHDCGPYLKWFGRDESAPAPQPDGEGIVVSRSADDTTTTSQASGHEPKDDTAILDKAASILDKGGVIAFKCVGGYNLVADPFNDEAVKKLREIKGRDEKPFAVMFRSLEQIRQFCYVSDVEAKLLGSSARPIVLLEHRLGDEGFVFPDAALAVTDLEDIKKSRFIGSFLPSLAAQYLLLDRTGPLIFTSANRSDIPMIKDDDEMIRWFETEPLIDGIIYNDRKIRVRVDDSVCRVIDGNPQMIRRSKGYAPLPLYVGSAPDSNAPSVFAAGGQLKNSFALTKGPFVYTSQYFGDMDTVEAQDIYRNNVERMSSLFRIHPEIVVCDMHPIYETTRFAEEYAKAKDLPLIKVQHHHAHVASVMAENDLEGPVIGVSFDGTGYGTDGRIWGGEFLLCENGGSKRMSHLRYTKMIGGDSSMKDARRSALSYLFSNKLSKTAQYDHGCRRLDIDLSDIIEFGGERIMGCPDAKMIIRAIDSEINTIESSSMGRLFDAVSSLLGICDYNGYEGQCAMMLEDAAAFALKHPGENEASDLALAFHNMVIDMIVDECLRIRDENGACQVALTGGTFQNRILMEGCLDRLRELGFKPYYNISVSPNDGGIALGQAYIAMQDL